MEKIVVSILVILLFAAVLTFSLGPRMLDRSLNVVEPHEPYQISDQAKKLHGQLIVGDWHTDSLMGSRDLAQRSNFAHVDLPRLQEGNVALQMFTTVTKSPDGQNYEKNETGARDNMTLVALIQRWPSDTWNSLAARALFQADRLHDLIKRQPDDIAWIRSFEELNSWFERRKENPKLVGALLGTEGSHALDGKLENVKVLFDKGFRMMSLQHFFDNKLGASLHGISQTGLTPFGREVVAKINELDIMLDVAHSSEQVVDEVLALSTRPLVVSHTGFKGHCDSPRNISDDHMQRIAKAGGLIAVGYWEGAICGTRPQDVATAIKYGVNLVGEDHVALGSDFDGAVTTRFDSSELAVLTQSLLDAGLNEDQIRKVMGGNMLRFVSQNLPI
ncbi:MAG: membrane dipeptidase [Cryomorphaceae bacterium]|jgi:membrane dipeptidase